jgi:class 3 adenylate cyclase
MLHRLPATPEPQRGADGEPRAQAASEASAAGDAICIVDSDPYSSQALLDELRARDFSNVSLVAGGLELATACSRGHPDIVLFNHRSDRPEEVLACCTARLLAPGAAIIAIASAGPAIKWLRQWNRENTCLETILEKPLQPGQLLDCLRDLISARRKHHELRVRADQLANLVPDGAMQALRSGAAREEEMFEAAVVFTDIRRSSELITSQPARAFFRVLNESLSAQGAMVHAHRGAVVKYTGDGMMAIFRGMGRSHLAVRCALALAAPDLQVPVGFGVGVAEGLVLAGLVGDFEAAGQRQQYDVIGSTVHLAARLCAQADPGQVIATRDVFRAARLPAQEHFIGAQRVRGFPAPIECIGLSPGSQRRPP